MFEIGHGIEVYYKNKKEVRNTVFFPDGTYSYNTLAQIHRALDNYFIECSMNCYRTCRGCQKPGSSIRYRTMKKIKHVKTVQQNAGHYSAAFTLDRYAHVIETMRRESADRMQNFFEAL